MIRFFHGTPAGLTPGTVVQTAAALGLLAQQGLTDSREWVHATSAEDADEDGLVEARAEAERWGAWAADVHGCDGSCRLPEAATHEEAYELDGFSPCVRVYEIALDGPVEPDPSGDVDHGGVRARSAVVLGLT